MKTSSATDYSQTSFHLLEDKDLSNIQISKNSLWTDARWELDNLTPGAARSGSIIKWDILLADGLLLTNEKHKTLLGWLRRLMWSLHAEPASGSALKPGSFGNLSVGMHSFVVWMVANGYQLPSELNSSATDAYAADIPNLLLESSVDDFDDFEITPASARIRLMIPIYLWRQRHVLLKAGILPIPDEPYQGLSANTLSLRIATKPNGWVKPLPDEVAIAVVNRATWFIGGPAEDIIGLQTACLKAYEDNIRRNYKHLTGNLSVKNKEVRQRKVAVGFRFSALDDQPNPWHPPLVHMNRPSTGNIDAIQRVRQLVLSLRNAATIVLLSASGMRISEVCGLPAGISVLTGLPTCVRIEDSATGLNELFIVRTLLSKTEESPRDVDWVIGMRPKGNTDIPIAVHALITLQNLLAPYRALLGSDRLLVSLSCSQGLPKNSHGVSQIRAIELLLGLRDFIEEWVDLSTLPNESTHRVEDNDLVPWRESKGRIIKAHMFRKLWAQFALALDSRLLPVIQMHFHHLSHAMTEGGYIGNNPLQMEPLQAVSRQQTNLLMFELATGKSLLAGRMGVQLEENIQELRHRINGLPTSDSWRETVRFCADNDLRLWFSPHGNCLPLSPASMRCHEVAGTTSWLNNEPNYSTREPSLCAGCSCFIIDPSHRDFWIDRYIQNWASYKQAERSNIHGQFRVIRERAIQAGKLLRKIGIDTNPLDKRIALMQL